MHVVPSHPFRCESICFYELCMHTQCMQETEFYDDNDDDGSLMHVLESLYTRRL